MSNIWKYQQDLTGVKISANCFGVFVILNFCWCWNLNLKQFSNLWIWCAYLYIDKNQNAKLKSSNWLRMIQILCFIYFIFLTAEEWPPPNVAIYHSITVLGWLPLSSMVYITSNSVTSKGQSQQNTDRDVDSERWLSVCQRFWSDWLFFACSRCKNLLVQWFANSQKCWCLSSMLALLVV